MRKFLNIDNPVMRGLSRVADCLIRFLNTIG